MHKLKEVVIRKYVLSLFITALAVLLLALVPNTTAGPVLLAQGYGYGGGGGGAPAGTTYVYDAVTSDGEFTEDVTVKSDDRDVELTIDEGTIGLTEDGKRLLKIEVKKMSDPPDPPEESHRIGLAYDLGPDGATFDPPAELTFTYDPDDIPAEVDEENLVLSMWDEEAGEWVDLECTVDPATNTITAKVSHFSAFSVIAYTRPAAFEATYLLVFPTQVDTGETVKARVKVTNTGDLAGSYKVTFKIDKEVVATRQVTLDGGASQQVEFSTSKDAAGTYTVSVNGLSGDFTVKAPPAPAPAPAAPAPAAPAPAAPAPAAPVPPAAPAVTWAIIGGIVVGVVVLILLIYFLWWKRRIS